MKLGTQIQTGLWDSITHPQMETLCCLRVWGTAQDNHGSGPLMHGKPQGGWAHTFPVGTIARASQYLPLGGVVEEVVVAWGKCQRRMDTNFVHL